MAGSGLARIWRQLATPVDPVAAADVLVGLRPADARVLLAVALASSEEAESLLDGLPGVLRSLSVSTASRSVRCTGEIRGPVLWSETMAARAASPGAGGVFVCASAHKAYDTDENRVLVGALMRIRRAARAIEVEITGGHAPDPGDLRRARHNGERARRALEHRSLQTVSRGTLRGRMVQKARTGTKAPVFRTAIRLLERSWAEVGAADLAPFVDDATRADHDLAAAVLDELATRGELSGRLGIVDGLLVGGRFAYGHPHREAAAGGGPSGVLLDGRPVAAVSDV